MGTRSTRPLPSAPLGSLRISGVVRDARGPVAGVELSATRVDAGSLSQRPCPEPLTSRPLETPVERCFLDLADSNARLVEARAGEAPLFARTVTAADGSFVLEGLPPGAFTLWALGDTGAAVRTEVQAGSQGVAVSLEEGFFLSGMVVDEEARTPIPKAWVTVVHESASRFFRVLADDEGRFRIGPLPSGRYLKFAGAEGRVPGAFRTDMWLNSDVDVTLDLYRKQRLEGVVLTPDKRPASGVTVQLRRNSEYGETVTTRSDAQGRFAFDGIPAKEYTVWAWSDGQTAYGDTRVTPPRSAVVQMRPGTVLEGTVRNEQGQPISGVRVQALSGGAGAMLPPETVTDGAGHYRLGPLTTASVELELTGAHHRVRREQLLLDGARAGPWDFTLTSGHSVDGTLVDNDGKPVPGVYLSLGTALASGGHSLAATNFQDAFGKSNEAGRFVAGALDAAGRWDLLVAPQGFIPLTLPVQVPSTGVRVVLDRGASVSGTVTDATGQPLPEVRIGLWDSASPKKDPIPDYLFTDSHGAFSVSGLKAGRYVMEAWQRTPGSVQWASRTVELKEREHADVALRFEEGRTLHGTTTDAAGKPLAGVRVQACLSQEDASAGQVRVLSCVEAEEDSVRSGPDGRFTLKHLTAPVYQLVARRDDLRLKSLRVPAGADDVRLVMDPAPRLKARFVTEEGAPIPSTVRIREASTVIACPGPTHEFQVEEFRPDGRFALPLTEDRQTWHVTVKAKGFLGLEQYIEASPGKDIDMGTVKLLRGRKVRFVILDEATRAPLAGARVSIELSHRLDGWPYEVAMPPSFDGNLDKAGAVEFEDLARYPIFFKVMTEKGLPQREGVVDTRQDVVTVTLPAPGR
ncbi:carboxypeptidase regulatory-like domain-containing protein [Corallococcus interemptor]|uniref:carboxypeptidase regulatory-like domain-containing protein n=1 Tax=Corallococcus interemptor TaxID=2316720 RepID=UPI003CFF3E43